MSADTSMPCIKYLRGRKVCPTNSISGRTVDPTNSVTFAMVPGEVLFDRRLRHDDVHGYAVMAYFRDNARVNTGQRRLAEAAGVSRRVMRRILSRLIEFGYIEIVKKGSGQAQTVYGLKSALFTKRSTAKPSIGAELGDTPAEEKPVSGPRELVRCPLCDTRCRQVLKVGWCRKCNWKREVGKVVDERLIRKGKTA